MYTKKTLNKQKADNAMGSLHIMHSFMYDVSGPGRTKYKELIK